MSTSNPTRPTPNAHDPWRVILVGRTGLDQLLRRDPAIELIRTRETVEAIGELADPIDDQSPAQPVVVVSPDAIEQEPHQRKRFINALRLVDPSVCVLIVDDTDPAFDAHLQRDHTLDQLVAAIANAIGHLDDTQPDNQPVALRLIDPAAEPISEPDADPVDELTDHAPPAQPQSAPETQPETQPEIGVVIDRDAFHHRAQAHATTHTTSEQVADLHRQVMLGTQPLPTSEPAGAHHAAPVLDDEPLVSAMLKGKPILGPALAQINARLGRADITLAQPSDPGAPLGVPVVVADQAVGVLTCPDEPWLNTSGRALLAAHAAWLSAWVRLELQQSELRQAAFTDPLTGAWNRRYFQRYLAAAIAQARAARQTVTVMVFDIDSFKHYNDTFGHGAGDEILTETVRLLQSVIRPSDRVCRVGGDEFAVIFYEPKGPREAGSKPLESIYQIAKRFQQQICNHRFPKLSQQAMASLTISGGLASFPWDGHDADSLLEEADRCAMDSKRQGKNAITLGPGAESVCKLDH